MSSVQVVVDGDLNVTGGIRLPWCESSPPPLSLDRVDTRDKGKHGREDD
jgi:hypothetical protein